MAAIRLATAPAQFRAEGGFVFITIKSGGECIEVAASVAQFLVAIENAKHAVASLHAAEVVPIGKAKRSRH